MQPAESARIAPGRVGRGVRVSPVLVGRADLVAHAGRRLTAAVDGTGHLLFLAGEAGIGKSRLLAEIAGQAHRAGVAVLRAATFPRDAEVAGALLIDLATELSRQRATAAAGAAISARLRATAGRDADAGRERRILVADLTATLLTVIDGGTGGLLLALEDLHWADELSLEVLDRLAGRLDGLALLVVATYRSDELYPKVPMRRWRTRLLVQRLAEEVRLPRLDPRQTAQLADAIAGATLSSQLTGALYARSDGIPLHVEELLGAVVPDDDGAAAPESLADAVLARAQALRPLARSVVAAASAIGRSFDVDLLAAVTGEEPDALDAALRELAERYLVTPRPDGSSFDFRHALIRDALYADLAPYRRRELHARVADAAVAAGLGDAFVSHQYERAGRPALAYRHARRAATEAATVSAYREAVALLRRARRTTPTDTPAAERAQLHAELATALAATDDNVAAAAEYASAHRLRLALDDPAAAAELVPPLVAVRHLTGAGLAERAALLTGALDLVQQRAPQARDTRLRLLAALAAAYMLDRRLAEAERYGNLALALATPDTDLATLLNLDATLGAVYVFGGRAEQGWRLIEAAVERGNAAGLETETARGYRMLGSSASVLVEYDRGARWLAEGIGYAGRVERWNDLHYLTAHRAHMHWAVGEWPDADREARRALADGGSGVTTLITALHVLGYLAVGRGDWSAAQEQLTQARELGTTMNELQRLSPALWGLAELALHRGDPAEAARWCEQGLAASAAVVDAAYLFPFLVTGVRAYLAGGGQEAARDWLARAGQPVRARAIAGTEPALSHAEGLLELAAGRTGRAREALQVAADGWARRRRFWEGTWALVDAARCAARSRRPGPAAVLAGQAREAARAAGATILVTAADAVTAAEAPAGPLTARELEVARLVAGGATNREIGVALHITPKTVAAHIEHILTKLGAARRTEVAAWFAARPPRQ